jgi:hypothetical protein
MMSHGIRGFKRKYSHDVGNVADEFATLVT